MKYYIASLILIGFLMIGKVISEPLCDPGYYDAGGFCKAEPTGCPYGDSLDKDTCAKFKEPKPVMESNRNLTEQEPTYEGK